MEEKIYSVSEAVRLVGVESHVLRYWEEELKIPIRRSSQGHRLYSERDIELFGKVREWRQKGLQLKAIRLLLNKEDVAEVIIAKQRNGPIGTVELAWLPRFTKFANMKK